MKYFMLEVVLGEPDSEQITKKVPIIFADFMNHDETAEIIMHSLRFHHKVYSCKPVSAGFITIQGKCHGKSETLKLESNSDDSATINTYDYTHGLL